jgi:hypothetical protein
MTTNIAHKYQVSKSDGIEATQSYASGGMVESTVIKHKES